MKIKIRKLTDLELMREACESTMQAGKTSKVTLDSMYRCEHSPIRTQMFWITMDEIPTFVSVHCVRHKVWNEHFVRTNRDDRGGVIDAGRLTPVRHSMLLNAEAFIIMSRKRLCYQAHENTRGLMLLIRESVREVDPDLARYMVPNCVYRGGYCAEKPCGNYKVKRYDPEAIMERMKL